MTPTPFWRRRFPHLLFDADDMATIEYPSDVNVDGALMIQGWMAARSHWGNLGMPVTIITGASAMVVCKRIPKRLVDTLRNPLGSLMTMKQGWNMLQPEMGDRDRMIAVLRIERSRPGTYAVARKRTLKR